MAGGRYRELCLEPGGPSLQARFPGPAQLLPGPDGRRVARQDDAQVVVQEM